jgi:hypothetical protein
MLFCYKTPKTELPDCSRHFLPDGCLDFEVPSPIFYGELDQDAATLAWPDATSPIEVSRANALHLPDL